jgi:hypothetical protein
MVAASLSKFEGKYFPAGNLASVTNGTNATSTTGDTSSYLSNDPGEAKVMLATCLSLFTGLFHVIICFFK